MSITCLMILQSQEDTTMANLW